MFKTNIPCPDCDRVDFSAYLHEQEKSGTLICLTCGYTEDPYTKPRLSANGIYESRRDEEFHRIDQDMIVLLNRIEDLYSYNRALQEDLTALKRKVDKIEEERAVEKELKKFLGFEVIDDIQT